MIFDQNIVNAKDILGNVKSIGGSTKCAYMGSMIEEDNHETKSFMRKKAICFIVLIRIVNKIVML